MNAGDIIVSIAANTASFIAEMDKVGQKISAFKSSIDQMGQSFLKGWDQEAAKLAKEQENVATATKKASENAKQLGSNMSEVAEIARTVAGALGVAFSVGAVINFVKGSVEAVARMEDLSKQTGIAASTLYGLKPIAEQAGTSIELFARAGFNAQRQLTAIKDTTDPTYIAIQQLITANKGLGLTFEQFRQADPAELMELLAKSLQNVANYQEKVNIVSGFFGSRIGKEMIPVLEAMAGGFEKLLTDEEIARVSTFSNQIKQLWHELEASVVLNFITAWQDFKQAIDDVSESFAPLIEGIKSVDGWLSSQLPTIKNTERELLNLAKAYTYVVTGARIVKEAVTTNPFAAHNTPEFDQFIKDKKQQIEDLNRLITELDSPQSHTEVADKITGSGAKPLVLNADAIKEQKKAIDGFIDSLKDQNDALVATQYAINHTAVEVKAFTLAEEKADFVSRLLRDSVIKTIPPQLLAAMDAAIAKILETTKAIEDEKNRIEDAQAQSKIWVGTINDLVDAEEKFAALKIDVEQMGWSDLDKKLYDISQKYLKLALIAEQTGRAVGASAKEIETQVRGIMIQSIMEQERAKVADLGESKEDQAITRAREFGDAVANSMTSGMRNTLMGIETGQQTLGEGMKNLLRNMMLELQGAVFDKTVLEPLKAIASGFIFGLVGALDDAANTTLKDWAEGLGKSVSQWISSGLQGIFNFGGFGGGGGAATGLMSGLDAELGFTGMGAGGALIPSFASGGLFRGHPGEFVLNAPATQKLGMGNLAKANATGEWPGKNSGSVVNVEINGDITPRQPNMSPDQVVKVTAGNITNDGMIMNAIEQRLRLRGK